MGVRPWLAMVLAVMVCVAGLYCTLPLAPGMPLMYSPEVSGAMDPYGDSEPPGIMTFWPVFAGTAIFGLSVALYFWLTNLPDVKYRPRRRS
jgi:hypothetical protein